MASNNTKPPSALWNHRKGPAESDGGAPKDPGHGDAIDLVRTDAKAKAALAILPEFDKGLGRRKDGPAHPDHLDEAACRIP